VPRQQTALPAPHIEPQTDRTDLKDMGYERNSVSLDNWGISQFSVAWVLINSTRNEGCTVTLELEGRGSRVQSPAPQRLRNPRMVRRHDCRVGEERGSLEIRSDGGSSRGA